ncbi:MAG: hypothetical protein ABSH30_10190 [Acidimicrobiales bacterium]
MSLPTRHTLEVPGARLHYQVQGSGPALMLVGHPMGAAGFAPIVPLLSEAYTVVTYDPRGFFPSTIDDPDQDAEPDLLADDVRRVLEAVGTEPAHSPPMFSAAAEVPSRAWRWSPASPTTWTP